MIARCRELGLVRARSEAETLAEVAACGVALGKNHLFAGRFSMAS